MKKVRFPTLEQTIEKIVAPGYAINPFLIQKGGKSLALKAMDWEKEKRKMNAEKLVAEMNSRKKVFIAAPYSKPDPGDNINKCVKAFNLLLNNKKIHAYQHAMDAFLSLH